MLMQQVLENKESLCTLILLLFICLVSTFEHEYVILYYISIIIPEWVCVFICIFVCVCYRAYDFYDHVWNFVN